MKHSRALTLVALTALLAILALLPACEDDPSGPPPPGGSQFQPLTSRSAIINNIEVAWNHRNSDELAKLLDEDFVFRLSAADVGGDDPDSWDRAEELANSAALFTSNRSPNPTGPECERISVNFDDDELTWTPLPATPSTSGETWYTTTIHYEFMFLMEPDITLYEAPGSAAQLTVRPFGDEWRLVEWLDVAGSGVTSGRVNAATATASWGAIKAMYRDSEYHALTSRRAVLHNLERAWINRDAAQIIALLDDAFVFYFSPGDVGGEIPEQWGRADELATSTALFESNTAPTPGVPVCTSVFVDLEFTESTIWVEVIPEDFPDETWYVTTIFHSFIFEMESGVTYIGSPSSKTQLTVREVDHKWRLIEWRDLGSSMLGNGAASIATTWGQIKALYK